MVSINGFSVSHIQSLSTVHLNCILKRIFLTVKISNLRLYLYILYLLLEMFCSSVG